MKKLVFIFLLALGFAGNSHAQTWTWVQTSPMVFCSSPVPTNSCTVTTGNIVPTVAGSVWIMQVQTPNNVTISSVSGGGGQWIHCPNCHAVNSNGGFSTDAWYNLTGNTGTYNGITITLSGSSGSFFGANFVELLPPAGYAASYDTSGTATPTNCSGSAGGTCTGVTLSLSATDAIWTNPGGASNTGWNSWSAPYVTDATGGGTSLNTVDGTAPTVSFQPCGSGHNTPCNPEFMAIAFKSSAGYFTPPTPTPQYSVVNVVTSQTCNTRSCVLSIPTTSAPGHLLFVTSGNEVFSHITSVTGGGTWAVPTGANTCQVQMNDLSQNNAFSCAYLLNAPSGLSSITVNMSGSGAQAFIVFEIAASTGSFALDSGSAPQGSYTCSGSSGSCTSNWYPTGQPLTLNGTNDVVFQGFWNVGGSLGPNYYAIPSIPHQFNTFLLYNASVVVLPNSGPSPPLLTWINAVSHGYFGFGIAFKASGTGTPLAPPTGLAAVVH